jgi:hypothetical protein
MGWCPRKTYPCRPIQEEGRQGMADSVRTLTLTVLLLPECREPPL